MSESIKHPTLLSAFEAEIIQSPVLDSLRDRFHHQVETWKNSGFLRRLWNKDSTLWSPRPQQEITDRLGWLDLIRPPSERIDKILDFADHIKKENFSEVVLLGMGGSSLAPEVFSRLFGNVPGYPRLKVLDSTHPDAVAGAEKEIDISRTLFVVSSKSGQTIETLSLFRYFWNKVSRKSNSPGRHFTAITDPRTNLENLALNRLFRAVFCASPNVGGRFSALSEFGLLPAALMGVDIQTLLDAARKAGKDNDSLVSEENAPALLLGALLGCLSRNRDKLTFRTSPGLSGFPEWLEQLIAESLGKDGRGLLPVVDEPEIDAGSYSKDRSFIHYRLEDNGERLNTISSDSLRKAGHPVLQFNLRDRSDLGYEIFRWELAVAAAGASLYIQPFNQPNVQLSKDLARRTMEDWDQQRRQPSLDEGACRVENSSDLSAILSKASQRIADAEYIAIQAYLEPSKEITALLQELRTILLISTQKATTLGIGPRFLHSTGQLHKGGPDTGFFIQIVDEPANDIPIPETGYTFGTLISAQSLGDFRALKSRGRQVIRINLGSSAHRGLETFIAALQ